MNLKRIQVGEQMQGWPSNSWNAICDAVEQLPRNVADAPLPPPPRGYQHAHQVFIRNDSGDDRARGSILGIDDSAFDLSVSGNVASLVAQPPVLSCIAPTNAAHWQKAVILLEPIGDEKCGHAAAGGIVWAKVNITDSAHTHARIEDSDADKMASSVWGAPILKKESGTGTKWCVIDLAGLFRPELFVGYTDGAISARSSTTSGSGTVSLYKQSGSTLSDTGVNVTAYNPFQNAVPISTYVELSRFAPNGLWKLTAADCEVA